METFFRKHFQRKARGPGERQRRSSGVGLPTGKPSPSRASSTWHPLLPRPGPRAVNLRSRSRALWTGVSQQCMGSTSGLRPTCPVTSAMSGSSTV
uniref:Diacylglycerol kinase zeta n=1 Tax=Mus musculus TaxID=10090 RepID=D6RIP2_MOUSE